MNRCMFFKLGCLIYAIFALYCHNARAASLQEQNNVIDEEMINKWKAYELFARALQGTARESTTLDSGEVAQRLLLYKQNQACVMNIISKEQDAVEICRIGNPDYAASIKRSKSDPNQVTLDKITQSPQGAFPGYAGEHVSVFDLTRFLISPHFTIINVPLSRFSSDPSFKILNVLKKSESDQTMTQIEYSYLYADTQLELEIKGQGSVLLDPTRCWCIHQSKYSGTTKRKGVLISEGEEEIKFELIDHPSGFPLVKTKFQRLSSYNHNAKTRRISTRRIDYQWEVNESVPNSEFTLSAFGLPEPMGAEPLHPSRTWLWLLCASLGAAALALIFVRLKNRHTRKALPPPSVS